MPKRIQMSRQHPWRAENPDAVIVARPSKWGNPFRAGQRIEVDPRGLAVYEVTDRDDAVRLFANWLSNSVDGEGRYVGGSTSYFGAESSARPSLDIVRSELAGKDLACWCPLDEPCHADVLLELANGGA